MIRSRVFAVVIVAYGHGVALAQSPGEDSAFGVYSSHVKRDQFISDMGWTDEQYYEWAEAHMQTLGAHWTRVSLLLLWSIIEPNLGDPYNWNAPPGTPDTTLSAIYEPPNQIHCLAVITPGMGPTTRNPVQYPNEWKAFVRAAAERYDGDGIDDADPNIRVNYFQLVNEDQDWRNLPFGTAGNYAQTARLTLDALRAANPNAKLVLVGTGGRPPFQQFIQDAIDACVANGVELTAIDLHNWASSDAFSWKVPNVSTARSFLDSRGLSGVQIWSTEHAAWTGCPTGAPVISEEDQVRWLIKSFTYNRERGLDKVQWSQLIDWYMFQGNAGSIFNSMGLLGDGRLNCETLDRQGTERIAYWAFRNLASKMDNGIATLLGKVSAAYQEDDLFAYEFVRQSDGASFFVVWSETGAQPSSLPVVRAKYHITNLVTDRYGNILEQYDVTASGGQLVVTVGGDPLLVEPITGPGDFDRDGDVDLADFAKFEICFAGPGGTLAPGCESGDFDLDNDIDCDDWAQFGLVWTGPGQLPELSQCVSQPIPTVSQWGLVALTMLLMTAATIVIRRTRRAQAPRVAPTSCVVLIALMTASAPVRAAQSPAGGGFVLVTERAGTTVAKIDVDTDQIIARATVGNQPSDLAADHLRRWVYVAAHLDHKIVAMKADTLETADLNIPGLGKLPIGVEITQDGGTLLVTTRGCDGITSADDRLDVIRLDASSWPPTGSLIASISTGVHPIGACLARDGRHAVITVRNQPAILIVDLQTNQIVGQAQNLPLDAEPEGCDAHPTANVVYVTLHGPVSTVEVFDLDTLTHVANVPIVHTPPAQPSTGVFTPDGGRFYVSGQTVNKVFLFETSDPLNPVQNMAVQLPVGRQPHFIVYLPGDRAYVANTNNEQPYGSLAIIHEYSAIPTVSGPILTDLAGPLRFVKFSSPGSGDFDSDGDVDADDAARFETCFTGANGGQIDPGCEPGDFDLDDDIDCDDWAQFGLVWTDPGQLPELSQCASQAIPAVSQWGSASMGLLLLTAATLVLHRGRSVLTP